MNATVFEDQFINIDNLETSEILSLDDIDINDLIPDDTSLAEVIKETEIIDDVSDPDDMVDDMSPRKRGRKKSDKKPQSEIDQELVNEFLKNQSHENFNKLWERFYYGVRNYANRFMHDIDAASEIASITFQRGWEFRHMYDATKSNFSTWLYTICRNLCLAEIYRVKKEAKVPCDISDLYDSDKLTNNIVTSPDKIQYTVEANELVANTPDEITRQLYNASINEINNLGGNYTKVLQMKLVENMKIREISDELNMNESNVKNYLYKGKDMLDNILKNKYRTLYEMYIDICSANDQEAV